MAIIEIEDLYKNFGPLEEKGFYQQTAYQLIVVLAKRCLYEVVRDRSTNVLYRLPIKDRLSQPYRCYDRD